MKDKIISIGFMIIISTVLILNIIMPDQSFSLSERRQLQESPIITKDDFFNGDFFKEWGNYTIDQFVFRDQFRTIKHFFASNIMGQLDINDIYYGENHIFKKTIEDKKSQLNMMAYMNSIKSGLFKNNETFFAMIPDKSYYFHDHIFKPDYTDTLDFFDKTLKNIIQISLLEALTLDSYFKTDPHWKQDQLNQVILKLAETMNFDLYSNLEMNQLNGFKGAYYSQGPLYNNSEKLIYLSHEDFKYLIIKNYENLEAEAKLYEINNIDGMDPFDIFLGGGSPLIEINNPNSTSEEELIIFRDSYGSNIAPLFLKHYRKVTLVDTRYMPVASLENYIEIDNQKVLFLYSALIINSSYGLK